MLLISTFEDYVSIAADANSTLIKNVFPDDPTLLAHSGLLAGASCGAL